MPCPLPSPTAEGARLAAVWSHDPTNSVMRATLASITAALAQLYGTRFALASVVDAATVHVVAGAGVAPGPYAREGAFCGHVVAKPAGPLIVPDAAADLRFRTSPLVTGSLQVRFYAGVALTDGGGNALGALGVLHDQPLDGGRMPLDALGRAAAQASQALQATRAMPVPALGGEPRQALERRREDRPVALPGPALWIGLRTEASGRLSWGRGPGRLVLGVAAGSPACQAGLRVGDILLAIDGLPTRRRHDVDEVLTRHQAGDVLQLRVLRGWATHMFRVTLEPLPEQRARRI